MLFLRFAVALLMFCPAVLLGAQSNAPRPPERIWGGYAQVPLSEVRPAKWRTSDGARDGWDWSLPPEVKPAPKSYFALFRTWKRRDLEKLKGLPNLNFKCNPLVEHWIRWKDLEPSEGNYDFEFLKDMIKAADSRGYASSIRLLTAGVDFAPAWLKKYNIPTLKSSGGDGVQSYDPAHPEFHRRYLKLVEALGESGIPQMEAVKDLYIGYASPSFGDEGIGPEGRSPDEFPHVLERLKTWANALSKVERKGYMGGWSDFGLSLGFGVRRGFVEMYLYHIPDKNIGQALDESGYLILDESAPLISQNAINGEENEEYESRWASAETNFRFGRDTSSFTYRYFSSTLRLIQMRCNRVLWNEFTLNPELFAWAALELGRSAKDSPDAWCFLRESYLKPYYAGKSGAVKNFERFLFQRDAENFETECAVKILQPAKMWMVDEKRPWDFAARRGERIGFCLAKDFLSGESKKVAVKITYFDDEKGEFALRFKCGQKPQSRKVGCEGSGKVKTATFFIEADFFGNPPPDFDFSIEGQNGFKPTVSFVRVVKLDSD